MTETPTEEWRPVVGYEDRYEVSSLGRVRSIDHVMIRSNGAAQTVRGKLLKPQVAKRGGYWTVTIERSPEQQQQYLANARRRRAESKVVMA